MPRDAQRNQLLTDDPDLALLEAMARSDPLALEELYRRRGPPILSYLSSRLNDRGLAEEVLQDVMLSAWRGASRFRGESRVYTWLLAIARNRATNAFHRQSTASAPQVSIDDTSLEYLGEKSPEIEGLGIHDSIHAALLAIPEEQRETLELVFFHELSLKETALVLSISTGTVKSRLHRAKARIREWMEREAKSNG